MARRSQYPPELRERAVRVIEEVRESCTSRWAVSEAVAAKFGDRVRGDAADLGASGRGRHRGTGRGEQREHAEIKRLQREAAELRRNDLAKIASAHTRHRNGSDAVRVHL